MTSANRLQSDARCSLTSMADIYSDGELWPPTIGVKNVKVKVERSWGYYCV